MSNYSKTTDFASKDALATGNANKIVKGTEIDDEFNAIQTAIATKANTLSPTLTGTPLAPTAASGTNTTQISTTAFVKAAVDAASVALSNALYPIGSIYTNATNNNNPATLLGFGTWVAFGSGRFLVGLDGADPLFDSSEEVGGSKDITGSTDSHALTVAEMPAHAHDSRYSNNTPQGLDTTGDTEIGQWGTDRTFPTSTEGSGDPHSHDIDIANANLPPYITVYMWKRTA